jgi:long-subunit acyl-CoA synthetase (AMP-forming)
VTGAAPISVEALEFVLALGIPLCEGWAMSETSPTATLNRPSAIRPGTVGRAMPDVEVRVADDGELLVRSPGVMRGYRNDPERTDEAVDADGFMHTGDIGSIDEDGYVRILDRKKELIINAAGKNMSPANIEAAVKVASPLIGSVVAIGDRRPYITALITLDADAAAKHASSRGLAIDPAALAADEAVQHAVAAAVTTANSKLSRVEQIKQFTVLPVWWTAGSDELTPTLKLKRTPIAEKYAAEIEALYER